ncbi:MAG: VTT domain-containing protein [Candidatus Nomurabacteria bacterium]
MKEKFLKWAENVANHKNALRTLFWVSFAESSFSPFPAYFLILFMLAHKVKYTWQKTVWIATLGSVIGGMLGYAIGFYLFKYIGQPMVNFYHLQGEFDNFGANLHSNQFFILLIAAMTPIPFKITAIASGVFAINLPLFIATAILGRGIKFVLVSFFTHKYGVKMKEALMESIWTSVITFVVIFFLFYYFFFR